MNRSKIIEEIKKYGYKVIEDKRLSLLDHDGIHTYQTFFEKSCNEDYDCYIELTYLSLCDWEHKEIDYSYYICQLPSNTYLLPLENQEKIDKEIKAIKENLKEKLNA